MLNFELQEALIDVSEIKNELKINDESWKFDVSRQAKIKVQRETEAIFLRAADRGDASVATEEVHASKDSPLAPLFPNTMHFLSTQAEIRNAELGRALFAKLEPGGQVYSHIDRGSYYACRDRYHLVISSADGSPMVCGDEEAVMREGELWWFDNKKPHEAFNRSSSSRIHLIFDLLPKSDPASQLE
ncbi:aspartyl/asparaginyl beta-hydroxylase domain-containing protein [Uliginosibacterium sp. TH139]|uniref:aspartyl/asparaginyl beta-hydroxylase domain-containing protein n=1 Tax=Uliginosibacterium sp. TH139 TaxID=2067453 RepID=UPI000C7A140B|nr:aspartyl/asparaginyl beta-hydroxylase domain-containing protein [Uliginosibacterium sp. TH139]PLK48576.1 hypothetical protein C0V76_10970 [Uliginosibacterium sp. TH139]